nr:probable ADP-ribosylation factor GTPase-activating protein AGD8 isoform X4 [Ipomoea batatas]
MWPLQSRPIFLLNMGWTVASQRKVQVHPMLRKLMKRGRSFQMQNPFRQPNFLVIKTKSVMWNLQLPCKSFRVQVQYLVRISLVMTRADHPQI